MSPFAVKLNIQGLLSCSSIHPCLWGQPCRVSSEVETDIPDVTLVCEDDNAKSPQLQSETSLMSPLYVRKTIEGLLR